MRKYLKSAGVILVISALLVTALVGCKSENGDANSSPEQANTTSQTIINDTYTSDTERENAHIENKKEETSPKTEENTASAADKTTNPTESAKVTEPSKTSPTESTKISEPSKTSPPTESTQETEKMNTPSSFKDCTASTSQFGTFKYWLYTPSNPTSNMPLIIYLHGGSGKGDDLNLITSVDGFPKYLQSGELGDVRAYVIIPQLPSSQKGWANVAASLYELIEKTVSSYKIDKSNISLTGHSMGGTGTYNIACSYPSLFARIAPLSGSVRGTADTIEKLKNIPIKAFVGSADTIVPPQSSEEVIAELKKNGANAQITVFDGADHFSVPALTYLDKNINLINWLIGN